MIIYNDVKLNNKEYTYNYSCHSYLLHRDMRRPYPSISYFSHRSIKVKGLFDTLLIKTNVIFCGMLHRFNSKFVNSSAFTLLTIKLELNE